MHEAHAINKLRLFPINQWIYPELITFLLTFASWSVSTPEAIGAAMSLILVLGDGVAGAAAVGGQALLKMDPALRTLLRVSALTGI